MDGLFQEVKGLSTAAKLGPATANPNFQDIADGIREAVDALAITALEHFETSAKTAARLGATRVDILRFHGGDIEEQSGVPYLTLVKGPRDPDLRAIVTETFLDRLRSELAPFKVSHVWHNRSNVNRIVVSWDEGDLPQARPKNHQDSLWVFQQAVELAAEELEARRKMLALH